MNDDDKYAVNDAIDLKEGMSAAEIINLLVAMLAYNGSAKVHSVSACVPGRVWFTLKEGSDRALIQWPDADLGYGVGVVPRKES